MTKWVNPATTTNDADIKLVHTDNTDVIANACKKISELQNKIVDIKANCDLAIEGRDVKIMELEQKLEQTEKDLADYQFNYPTIKELENENAELKKELKDANEKVVHLACNQNKDLKHKLTKATELLKEAQGYIENIDDVLYDEIEQFLKE